MNNFELKLWNDEGDCCTIYTVKQDGSTYSETDKFFIKYEDDNQQFNAQSTMLHELLILIAEVYGATDDFFTRAGNVSHELPPKPKYKYEIEELEQFGINFPLRLFCYRVSETILVVFNGGEKTAWTNQDSKLSMQFREAEQFAKAISKALIDGTVKVSANEKYLLDNEGNKEVYF